VNTIVEFVYRLIVGRRALVFWATVIVIAFGIVHLLGWREFTTVLSGTIPKENSEAEAAFKGLAYMAAYFAAVLVAPICLLAIGISYGLERALRISRDVR
jgi:SNF family Na+-dependent transporter